MKNLRTHKWSTPATIGFGVFVSISGLFMFFVAEQPIKFAHEIAGIAFSAAIVLHVLSNWRSFRGYFTRGRAVGIVVTAWLIGAALIITTALSGPGEADQVVTDSVSQAPIATLAPIAGKDLQELVDQLRSDGYAIEDPAISAEQLATQLGADLDNILMAVFR